MPDGKKPKKEALTTRVTKNEYDEFQSYCNENELSQADALRKFVRRGLANEGRDVTATDGGAVAEQLDELQAQQREVQKEQRRSSLRQTTALMFGLLYIGIEFQYDPNGLVWPLAGVAADSSLMW